jgi:hypothetical protein
MVDAQRHIAPHDRAVGLQRELGRHRFGGLAARLVRHAVHDDQRHRAIGG